MFFGFWGQGGKYCDIWAVGSVEEKGTIRSSTGKGDIEAINESVVVSQQGHGASHRPSAASGPSCQDLGIERVGSLSTNINMNLEA